MVLTLKELVYVRMDFKQRKQIPPIVRHSIENKLVNRIIRVWRNSHLYKVKMIEERLKTQKPLTKRSIVYLLRYKLFPLKLTIKDITMVLHGYFHQYKPGEYMGDKNMRQILDLFVIKAQNNMHNFFGLLWGLMNHASEIEIELKTLYSIFSGFSKEILIDMYTKLC